MDQLAVCDCESTNFCMYLVYPSGHTSRNLHTIGVKQGNPFLEVYFQIITFFTSHVAMYHNLIASLLPALGFDMVDGI